MMRQRILPLARFAALSAGCAGQISCGLQRSAGNWATGLRQHDADDLLNEALDRVLSGRRTWPIDVPLLAFLSQVMRSIASQWRKEDAVNRSRRTKLVRYSRRNASVQKLAMKWTT